MESSIEPFRFVVEDVNGRRGLGDLAVVGCSETAGPFMVTFDTMFRNEETSISTGSRTPCRKSGSHSSIRGVAVDDVLMFMIRRR